MALYADCPKCDPLYPELDESGRPYTCYFCGDTGRVLTPVAEAYWRAEDDLREQFRGRHVGGCWKSRRYDEEGPCGPAYVPLFTGLAPQLRRPPPPRPVFEDDLPF